MSNGTVERAVLTLRDETHPHHFLSLLTKIFINGNEGHCELLSQKAITTGFPLAMTMCAIAFSPLLKRLQLWYVMMSQAVTVFRKYVRGLTSLKSGCVQSSGVHPGRPT